MDAPNIAWGMVTQITPTVTVRFRGDTVDSTITRGNTDISLAVNDIVVMFRLSTSGGWSIGYVDVAIP